MKKIETTCPLCGKKYEIPEGEQFLEENGYIRGVPGNICWVCQRIINCEEEIKRLRSFRDTD